MQAQPLLKECQIHLIETKQSNPAFFYNPTTGTKVIELPATAQPKYKAYHIYLTDDKPALGDLVVVNDTLGWLCKNDKQEVIIHYVDSLNKTYRHAYTNSAQLRRIIATTDTDIMERVTIISETHWPRVPPTISKDFILRYCKENFLDRVLIPYYIPLMEAKHHIYPEVPVTNSKNEVAIAATKKKVKLKDSADTNVSVGDKVVYTSHLGKRELEVVDISLTSNGLEDRSLVAIIKAYDKKEASYITATSDRFAQTWDHWYMQSAWYYLP